MPSTPPGEPPGGPPRLTCRCLGISSLRIVEAIQSQGLTQIAQLQSALRAGTGCETCHPELEELLADARGEPLPEQVRSQNRALCQRDSERRIEAALELGVVPNLAPGSTVDLIWLEGLRVELQVTPGADSALRQLITEKLRKSVCPDLEIVFRHPSSG